MEMFRTLTTKEKALKVNLNSQWYGSMAEIGAGQGVADNFFRAGGASGTVAKTMSAYDMQFSDAIYGKASRYVSLDRLMTMLGHEFELLQERLTDRAEDTCFFAFADTVETLNYRKTNQGHGWMGIRYQVEPGSGPNDILLHVVLKDNESLWQQEAIGILGVNLIYACYHFPHDTDQFLRTLMEGLSADRIEIDMFRMEGPNFDWVDNRLLSLKLVKMGIARAAMFGPDGRNLHASEVLYKRNILVLRGRFRPATKVNVNMRESGMRQFLQEGDVEESNLMMLTELTLQNLTAEGRIEEKDFLDRVDILCSMGHTVLISNLQEYYKLVSYLKNFNRGRKIGIILGVHNLQWIFEEKYYKNLGGGILEAFGILFGTNIKLYVYPAHRTKTDASFYTCENFELPTELMHLYRYLHASNKVEDIQEVDPKLLHIYSDDVLAMIKSGEPGWEEMVPVEVANAVKSQHLFEFEAESTSEPKALE